MDEDEIEAPAPWDDTEEETEQEELSVEDLQAQLAEARTAAQTAKTELEQGQEAIKKQKSGLDRNKTEWLQKLDALGIKRTEDGEFAISDLSKMLGKGVAAPVSPAQDAPLPSPWEDGYAEAMEARMQARLEAKLAERDKQWEDRMGAVTGMTLQTQQPAVEQAVAKVFERAGLVDLHKEPEFQAFMADALKQPGQDPLLLANPQYMAQVAASALPLLPDEVIDRVRQKAEQRRSEESALEGRQQARQEQRQMQTSGGTRVTAERGGRPAADLVDDVAGQLVESAFEGHHDSHYYDHDLNRAIGAGKADLLIEKRRKTGARR